MDSDWLPPNATRPSRPLQLPSWLALLSENVQATAVDLRGQHVAEAGFPMPAAMAAAEELAALGFAILGGDVWDAGGSVPVPTGQNWHAGREPNERWAAFTERAAGHTRDRITVIEGLGAPGTALYVLVAVTEREYDELIRQRGDR